MHPNLLDQLAVFRTVADTGSFAEAARRLNRQVSAISYAVTNLETHLGLTLVDRASYRAGLTAEGRALLSDVDVLLRRVERLEGRATAIGRDVETALAVIAEPSVSSGMITAALTRFERGFPDLPLTLLRADSAEVVEAVREGRADLGITVLERGLQWTGIDGAQLLATRILVAAAPEHPLAEAGDVTIEQLEHHRQIYLASGDPPPGDTPYTDYRIHRTDFWRAGDLATQLALIEAGLGWGFVPEDVAAPLFTEGRLAEIALPALRHPPLRRFAIIWRTGSPPGPAARALIDAFGHAPA